MLSTLGLSTSFSMDSGFVEPSTSKSSASDGSFLRRPQIRETAERPLPSTESTFPRFAFTLSPFEAISGPTLSAQCEVLWR